VQNEDDSSVKIERDEASGRNTFTGYGAGYVEVNRARHTQSLVVGGDRIVADWPARSVQALSADHMAAIVELAPASCAIFIDGLENPLKSSA